MTKYQTEEFKRLINEALEINQETIDQAQSVLDSAISARETLKNMECDFDLEITGG